MGNAEFAYYPVEGGKLEKIDLGSNERWSTLAIAPIAKRSMSERSGSGRVGVAFFGSHIEVRITYGPRPVGTWVYDMWALDAHLQRGGYAYITDDDEKYLLASPKSAPVRDDTTWSTKGNPFSSFGTLSAASGDPMWLHSPNPEARYEVRLLSSYTASSPYELVLQSGVRYSYEETPVIARYWNFFPYMQLSSAHSGPIIHKGSGKLWTFDATFAMDMERLFTAGNAGDDEFMGPVLQTRPTADAFDPDS